MDNKVYLPQEIIFLEGAKAEQLYIIKRGEVRLVKGMGKKMISLGINKEKDFLGEIALFAGEKYEYTAYATKETELVPILKEELELALSESPKWAKDLIVTLGKRLSHSEDIVREHHLHDESYLSQNALIHEEYEIIEESIKKFKNRF